MKHSIRVDSERAILLNENLIVSGAGLSACSQWLTSHRHSQLLEEVISLNDFKSGEEMVGWGINTYDQALVKAQYASVRRTARVKPTERHRRGTWYTYSLP